MAQVGSYARERELHEALNGNGRVENIVSANVIRPTGNGWGVDVTYYFLSASPWGPYQSGNVTDRFQLTLEEDQLVAVQLGS